MSVMLVTTVIVAVFALMANMGLRNSTVPEIEGSPASERKPNRTSYFIFVFVCAAILALVSGLRFSVGTDFGSYYWKYPLWITELQPRMSSWDEPGLSLIATILSWISDDGMILILGTSILTVFLFLIPMAKHTSDFFFVLLVYLFCGCWSGAFNGVRQYLAAAILFAGHRLMYERKFLKFCIIVFIAASFHITALIMLPVYFLITKKLDLKKIMLILISGFALVFSYDFLFNIIGVIKDSDTGGADTNYAQTEINPLRIAIAFAPIILFILLKVQHYQFSGEDNFYIGFVFVRAALVFGTSNSAYLNRAVIFFNPFLPIALFYLASKFDRRQQAIVKGVILILYAICWIVTDASKVEWKWIFNRPGGWYNKYE